MSHDDKPGEVMRLYEWCKVPDNETRCFSDRVLSALTQLSAPSANQRTFEEWWISASFDTMDPKTMAQRGWDAALKNTAAQGRTRIAKTVRSATQPTSRDWTEDAAHENGEYSCTCSTCGNLFIGHKRRVTCKVCHVERTAKP